MHKNTGRIRLKPLWLCCAWDSFEEKSCIVEKNRMMNAILYHIILHCHIFQFGIAPIHICHNIQFRPKGQIWGQVQSSRTDSGLWLERCKCCNKSVQGYRKGSIIRVFIAIQLCRQWICNEFIWTWYTIMCVPMHIWWLLSAVYFPTRLVMPAFCLLSILWPANTF